MSEDQPLPLKSLDDCLLWVVGSSTAVAGILDVLNKVRVANAVESGNEDWFNSRLVAQQACPSAPPIAIIIEGEARRESTRLLLRIRLLPPLRLTPVLLVSSVSEGELLPDSLKLDPVRVLPSPLTIESFNDAVTGLGISRLIIETRSR